MKITQDKYKVQLELSGRIYIMPKILTKSEVTVQVYINSVLFCEEGENKKNIITFLI